MSVQNADVRNWGKKVRRICTAYAAAEGGRRAPLLAELEKLRLSAPRAVSKEELRVWDQIIDHWKKSEERQRESKLRDEKESAAIDAALRDRTWRSKDLIARLLDVPFDQEH